MFSKIFSKRIASKWTKGFEQYLTMMSRYELNCLEEKFQVHLDKVESNGRQRRIKPTGLR